MSTDTEQAIATAISLAVLKEKIEQLETMNALRDKEVESLKKDRDSALRWGILVLGSTVISMALWIFKLFEKAIPHIVS